MDVFNLPPVPDGGTVTATISNSAGPFTRDLKQYFTDDNNSPEQLSYATTGSIPPGMQIIGTNLVHDNSTWAPSAIATTYNFGVSATDMSGAQSNAQDFSIILDPEPLPHINYIPNWNSPNINMTSSGAVSLPSGTAPYKLCYVYLVGSGGGGNSSLYNPGWYFGGRGGSARLIICRADVLDGAQVTIRGGAGPGPNWQATGALANQITIGAQTYNTAHNNANEIIVHPGTYKVDGLSTTGFNFNQSNETQSVGINITHGRTTWGLGNDSTGSSGGSVDSGSSASMVYAGGMGYAQYGATGYETSQYAGDGASGLNQNGNPPGGGASYQATGGTGSCRIYIN